MAHIDHLKSICELEGIQVVDVGAGDGVYSRDLYVAGAKVTAIEIDPDKVAKAKEDLPKNIDVRLGAAEDLPLDSGSQDLACLFFSLHHVPVEAQNTAFTEIRRVLGSSGRLHIVEPYPYGTMFDVVRLVEDETLVRTHSHETLNHLDGVDGFRLENKKEYVLTREYPTFEAFLEKIVWPDPDRSRAYEKVSSDVEDAFNRSVETLDGKIVLHQPCAAYHFIVSC
ncbi:class I SAM-dependent methyltransferase [Ruegeria arenilitoris]|uniref:class I SAM-dependent methyltransferase n=1 Tax=Ruegeria arenilitoris TaxID=1173585 RepID=UPI00147F7B3B|nr:class I SAM-dependent methyltransferase [Ruegeria arenilitoris]